MNSNKKVTRSVVKYGFQSNMFCRQQYRCSKCGHVDWWNYTQIQLRDGRMWKKPWSFMLRDRPTHCKKCNKELDFGYGNGIDMYRDSYVPYWRGLFIILFVIFGGGFYLSYFHNIQIFEELARFIFSGMQIN